MEATMPHSHHETTKTTTRKKGRITTGDKALTLSRPIKSSKSKLQIQRAMAFANFKASGDPPISPVPIKGNSVGPRSDARNDCRRQGFGWKNLGND